MTASTTAYLIAACIAVVVERRRLEPRHPLPLRPLVHPSAGEGQAASRAAARTARGCSSAALQLSKHLQERQ